MSASLEVQRLRIVFAKEAELRYISHLDLMRAWERALRRARLPVAHTQGFNPRPRLLFAAALAVGWTGSAELLDLFLEQRVDLRLAARALLVQLPPGLEVSSITEVDLTLPSLPAQVSAAEYRIELAPGPSAAELGERVARLLAATSLPRRRERPDGVRSYDLRPLVQELRGGLENGCPLLWARLQADGTATGRPDELVDELGLGPWLRSIERVQILFKSGV
ncbi:MAG TPA: TIGR03936 family radical SAM-associated protein [Anaerolineae bacterium]|nr:TIGR03936 family radical SAM-associated protein [Anaerolineae bacterium]